MIESWLQFTCDECGTTCNSVAPNMSRSEFRRDELIHRGGGMDLCQPCWLERKLQRGAK